MNEVTKRPTYHFTPAKNWMNDPNGLVFYKNRFHLFFQYNPSEMIWGNMSWGHASSTDLVHWEEHPVAILFDENEAIFSGSVIVDSRNTSGFSTNNSCVLVAIYTNAYKDGRQAQSIAFSNDDGLTWAKFAENPVLDRNSHAFRDPKVFWYSVDEMNGYWVMVAVEALDRKVHIYKSNNLKDWDALSSYDSLGTSEGIWECPDLIPLSIAGESEQVVWVLIISVDLGRQSEGSFVQYQLGNFDGRTFIPLDANGFKRFDLGRDFYACTSFSNLPKSRQTVMGWMNNWNYAGVVPTNPWRGSMSLPRDLTLEVISDNLVLKQKVPIEFSSLIEDIEGLSLDPCDLNGSRFLNVGDRFKLEIEFESIDSPAFIINLLMGEGQVTQLLYDFTTGMMTLDRSRSGKTNFEASFAAAQNFQLKSNNSSTDITILVDVTSIEIFAQGGSISATSLVFPSSASHIIELQSAIGSTRILHFRLIPL